MNEEVSFLINYYSAKARDISADGISAHCAQLVASGAVIVDVDEVAPRSFRRFWRHTLRHHHVPAEIAHARWENVRERRGLGVKTKKCPV